MSLFKVFFFWFELGLSLISLSFSLYRLPLNKVLYFTQICQYTKKVTKTTNIKGGWGATSITYTELHEVKIISIDSFFTGEQRLELLPRGAVLIEHGAKRNPASLTTRLGLNLSTKPK